MPIAAWIAVIPVAVMPARCNFIPDWLEAAAREIGSVRGTWPMRPHLPEVWHHLSSAPPLRGWLHALLMEGGQHKAPSSEA